MYIKEIRLSGFRNFKKKRVQFSDNTTVILGPNASGKTNILESIYLLSTGKSYRARLEEEMVNHNSEVARVEGLLTARKDFSEDYGKNVIDSKDAIHSVKLEVILTRGEITIGENPKRLGKVPKKKLLVNGVPRRLFNFSGNLRIVLFGPWDMDLVTESPSIRRRFMDFVLGQVDREYRRASLSYEKGLRQRNRLLLRIRDEGIQRSQLLFWDKLLIRNGNYISLKRAEFIEFVNGTKDFNNEDFSLEYDKSVISQARLDQYAQEEVASATTLVGPHRDDFCFFLKKNSKARDLSRYGSRGEQRMGVLWLKLAELLFIEDASGEKPVLLLDDIFSELDHEHRDVVMKVVRESDQVIITTADPHFVRSLKNFVRVDLS